MMDNENGAHAVLRVASVFARQSIFNISSNESLQQAWSFIFIAFPEACVPSSSWRGCPFSVLLHPDRREYYFYLSLVYYQNAIQTVLFLFMLVMCIFFNKYIMWNAYLILTQNVFPEYISLLVRRLYEWLSLAVSHHDQRCKLFLCRGVFSFLANSMFTRTTPINRR